MDQIEIGVAGYIHCFPGSSAVAFNTMRKAVEILKSQQILAGFRGQCSRILPKAGKRCEELLSSLDCWHNIHEGTYAWQRLQKTIEKDIAGGVFSATHALPSVQQLQNRYPANYRTIMKALSGLCANGFLIREGKVFRVAFSVMQRGFSVVQCFVYGNDPGIVNLSGLNGDFLRQCAQVAHERNINLDVITYTRTENGLVFSSLRNGDIHLHGSDNVLGYIAINRGPRDNSRMLADMLFSTKKPVALYDAAGEWERRFIRNIPQAKIFQIATSAGPGRDVGHYLADLGHRHVAFISPYHDSLWAQNRYRGLQEALRAAAPSSWTLLIAGDLPPENIGLITVAREIADFDEPRRFFNTWSSASRPISIAHNAGNLTINLHEIVQSKIFITSINGRILIQKDFSQQEVLVPLNSIASGLYLLNIISNSSQMTRSLIIP
ncbi:MAG: T9SS type A sorting domain-containing protein [Chitinivibrionales bacterium]|nr:T9SS type A sorting domain-containing protein [Chitinivibrionales bacterium]